MRNSIFAAVIVASLSLMNASMAQDRIDQRQANQQSRIGQGVQSGQLTPKETIKLERGQAKVQRVENRAKADGVVTRAEARRVSKMQNVQSRKIYRKKHN
jgi:hypothetical protein